MQLRWPDKCVHGRQRGEPMDETQTQQVHFQGLDAFRVVMQAPDVPIYRRSTMTGTLRPLTKEEAGRLCARGAHECLWVVL
jgi:hypothetical protein